MGKAVRILIADDQARAREGLKALLQTWPDLDVVGEAADCRAVVSGAMALHPDVVLMDVRMPQSGCGVACCPELGGIEATRCIKSSLPGVCVLVLTMFGVHREAALMAGADAFMLKGGDPEQLVEMIWNCVGSDAS